MTHLSVNAVGPDPVKTIETSATCSTDRPFRSGSVAWATDIRTETQAGQTMPRSHHRLRAQATASRARAAAAQCHVSSVTTSISSPSVSPRTVLDPLVGVGELGRRSPPRRPAPPVVSATCSSGSGLHRDRHDVAAAGSMIDPVGGAEGDREHRDAGVGGDLRAVLGRRAERRLAVGQQHDRARGDLLLVGRPCRRPPFLQLRRAGSVPAIRASPIAVDSASSRLVDRRGRARSRSSVGGDLDGDRAAERDRARPRRRRRPGRRSRVAASLAASSRVGSTSVASIDSDTSNSTRIRPSLACARSSSMIGRAMATTPAARPSSCSAGDDVAAPPRPATARLVEQVDLGEAHGGRPPPAQHGDVGDAEGGDGEQPPQPLAVRGTSTAITSAQHLGVDGLDARGGGRAGRSPPSQSPSVRQLDDVGAGPAQGVRAAARPALGGGLGEAALHGGGDADLAAARRSPGRRRRPDRPAARRARVGRGRDRQQVVAHAEAGQRVDPAVAGEVGDHARRSPRRRLSRSTRSIAPARSLRPRPSDGGGEAIDVRIARTWSRPKRGGITLMCGPATSTAPRRFWLRAVRKPTHAAAARATCAFSSGGRAEAHRRRDVDDEPGLEVAVGDLVADVGLAGAGRDVPVDAADVVARLVQPRLAGLAAVTRA